MSIIKLTANDDIYYDGIDPETLNTNHTIYGGRGNDTIDGGTGSDHIHGALDNDVLYGQDGNDWLQGGRGNDILDGSTGNDDLYGGLGNDYLEDLYDGGYLYGGAGDDILRGGVSTVQQGGTGNDFLIARDMSGVPDDNMTMLTGGRGSDTFQFRTENDGTFFHATITDFDASNETLILWAQEDPLQELMNTGEVLSRLDINHNGTLDYNDTTDGADGWNVTIQDNNLMLTITHDTLTIQHATHLDYLT